MPTWDTSDPAAPAIWNGRPEPSRAHQALLDYLRLGPTHSFSGLFNRYRDLPEAPTRSHGTLRNWSIAYEWLARADRYDRLFQLQAEEQERDRQEAILQEGLAARHERIEFLVGLFKKLTALAEVEDSLWITTLRSVQRPDGEIEHIRLRRFNAALIREIRAILNDIASETGGRYNHLHTLPETTETLDFSKYSIDVLEPAERAEFIRIQKKIFDNPAP